MPQLAIPDAETRARELSHDIEWMTIGQNVAHGRCARCGLSLSIARTADGFRESSGPALEVRCTGKAAAS